jgi:hypothetical protein
MFAAHAGKVSSEGITTATVQDLSEFPHMKIWPIRLQRADIKLSTFSGTTYSPWESLKMLKRKDFPLTPISHRPNFLALLFLAIDDAQGLDKRRSRVVW